MRIMIRGREKRKDPSGLREQCHSLELSHQANSVNRHDSDGPTLEWYKIQDEFKTADSDILIVLDCCFAAQAGRAKEKYSNRIELLAAAGMGTKTPMPGKRSFTKALIREISSCLGTEGEVLTTTLLRNLVARKAELWATPFWIPLLQGRGEIRLKPMGSTSTFEDANRSHESFYRLIFRTQEDLNSSNVVEIARWLGNDMPGSVTTLKVEAVLQTTTQLHNMVQGISHDDMQLGKVLDQASKSDILTAWQNVITLIKQYHAQQHDSIRNVLDTNITQQRSREFLKQLDAFNSTMTDTLERHVLNSCTTSDPSAMQEILHDPAAQSLGIADQLRLRQIVLSSDTPNTDGLSDIPSQSASAVHAVLQEYKVYAEHTSAKEMSGLAARAHLLAELLSAPKSEEFRSLRCFGLLQEELDHRFVLQFEIPTCYGVDGDQHSNLQALIRDSKGPKRPTLNERFHIALVLAKAVQKWHSVGWLHQGISGPNVIFFTKEGSERVDYMSPFLQGFDFSRPGSDPSIGISTNNIGFEIYRHIDRQGAHRKGHRKIHDLYSLGVVLLEIGLWQNAFDIISVSDKNSQLSTPRMKRDKLLGACSRRLAHYAGTAYASAVNVCLSGNFEVDLDDAMESRLARSFENKVIKELSKVVSIL
jgi:hypothetical protein